MAGTGAEEIIALHDELAAAEVEMWLARLHGDALTVAQRAGVIDAIGEDHITPTLRSAGQIAMRRATDPSEGATRA